MPSRLGRAGLIALAGLLLTTTGCATFSTCYQQYSHSGHTGLLVLDAALEAPADVAFVTCLVQTRRAEPSFGAAVGSAGVGV